MHNMNAETVVEGKELTCNHCKYTWLYKGHSDYYTSCPRCHANVRVKSFTHL